MTSTHQAAPVGRQDRRIERDSWVPTLGPGMVLGAISTIGLVVAMLMSWRTPDVHPSGILLALIPMAILLGVGTAMPRASAARLVGALGTIVVATLFVIQLNSQLDAIPGANVGDVLDTGFYVAAIAGLVGLVSGFMPSGWFLRRSIEMESTVDRGGVNFDEPRV